MSAPAPAAVPPPPPTATPIQIPRFRRASLTCFTSPCATVHGALALLIANRDPPVVESHELDFHPVLRNELDFLRRLEARQILPGALGSHPVTCKNRGQ